jgi:hypothetical protein
LKKFVHEICIEIINFERIFLLSKLIKNNIPIRVADEKLADPDEDN